MSVVRTARTIHEVSYALDAAAVRGAVFSFLYDAHAGAWNEETTITFLEDGGAIVKTPFVNEDQSA